MKKRVQSNRREISGSGGCGGVIEYRKGYTNQHPPPSGPSKGRELFAMVYAGIYTPRIACKYVGAINQSHENRMKTPFFKQRFSV